MTKKTALSTGLFVALIFPAAVTLAEDEVKTQARTTDMVERAHIYAQQDGRYQPFEEVSQDEQQAQNRNQHRYGADNDTGQGTRTRHRHRDGSTLENQYGSDNDSGQGTRTRQRSRDGSGSGHQHRYGSSSTGGSQHGGGRRH